MEAYKIGKKTPIKMPSSWQDVSYAKGIKILEGKLDQVHILALLTDHTVEDIRAATDPETIYHFTNAFEFLNELPQKVNEFPRSVVMGKDRFIFPFISYADKFDLGKCEVGQVEDMIAMITKMSKEFTGDEDRLLSKIEMVKICPFVVAIYLQKIIDHHYNGESAMQLVDRVEKELSMKEVCSIGYFFLMRLTAYRNGSREKWSHRTSILRRSKLAFLNLIQRLVSLLP